MVVRILNNIKTQVINILSELEINNKESFENEIDSLTFVLLIIKLEATFGIEIEDEYFLIDKMSSLSDINDYLEMKVGK